MDGHEIKNGDKLTISIVFDFFSCSSVCILCRANERLVWIKTIKKLTVTFFGYKFCNVPIGNFRMVIDDQSSKDWTVTLKNSILGENNILGTIVMSFLYWVLFSLIRKLFRNISEEHSWSAVHQKNINSTKQYSVLFQHFRRIRIFKSYSRLFVGTVLKDSFRTSYVKENVLFWCTNDWTDGPYLVQSVP